MLGRLLAAATRFVVRNSWPVLAVTAAYLAAQFAFDFGQSRLDRELDLKGREDWLVVFQLAVIFFQAALDTVYKAAFWPVAWSRLAGAELSFSGWRRGLGRAPVYLFGYFLIYYTVFIFSLAFGMLPFLVFLTALPYLEIIIALELHPLRPAWRKNLELLRAAFFPAAMLSFLRFICLGFIFYNLWVLDFLPRHWLQAGGYLGQVLCVAVDAAALALYYTLTQGKPAPGFPELAAEDGED